jgi:uncharacterized membrane protein
VDLRRLLRHLAIGRRTARRAFPPAVVATMVAAVRAAEQHHRAEIRFVVESALEPLAVLRGQSPRERALEVFALLRVWDTERNDGVLIHVLLADRAVEIVADRGVHAAVRPEPWPGICRAMEAAYRRGDYEGGSLAAIHAVAQAVGRRAAVETPHANELPDEPVLM